MVKAVYWTTLCRYRPASNPRAVIPCASSQARLFVVRREDPKLSCEDCTLSKGCTAIFTSKFDAGCHFAESACALINALLHVALEAIFVFRSSIGPEC